MASTRCPNCNFLNFANQPECKRCRQPIGDAAVETVSAGQGTGSMRSVNTRPAPRQIPRAVPATSYYEPPPPNFYREISSEHPRPWIKAAPDAASPDEIPPLCVKCGGQDDLAMQNFKKDYVPPAAYLAILTNPIILLIVILIAKKRHKISGLFCAKCWSKYKNYSAISVIYGLLFFATFTASIVIAIKFENPLISILAMGLSITIGLAGAFYAQHISPKFVKMSRKKVFIKIPNYGEVDFSNSAS